LIGAGLARLKEAPAEKSGGLHRSRSLERSVSMKTLIVGLVVAVTGVTAVSGLIATFDAAAAYNWGDLTDCSRWKNDPNRSIVACTKLIETGTLTNIDLAHVYRWRGSAYGEMGDYEDAMADFEKADEAARRFARRRSPSFDREPWYP
jgi:tetratricopeptide (TPR) repeat protein